MVMPPSQRVLYQSDENAQLKQFLTKLETTIDLSQFAAMGGTALAGVAANKGAISSVAASGMRSAAPIVKGIETGLIDFGKGLAEFNKGGGFKKLFKPFEVAGNGVKFITPKVIKDFVATFKPFQDLLTNFVKQGKPIFENFFKGLGSFTSNFYAAIKNKLNSVGTSSIQSVNSLQQTQNVLAGNETRIATNINNLNDKFKANTELNKAAPIKNFDTIQDQLKQNITASLDELNANDKLLKQYDELIKAKQNIFDLDQQINKLRISTDLEDKNTIKTLRQKLIQEERKSKNIIKQLEKDLTPEQQNILKNEEIITKADRKINRELADNKRKLQGLSEQKTVINDNLGKGGTDTVSIKNYDADQRALKSLTQQEEALNKVIREQENALKGLNKARQVGSTQVLQNTDDAIKLATELNKTTVAMQNLGKAFQTYVKATDIFLTGTSITKAFLTLQEGIQDVTRAVKDAESALLIMQKQGFDISGFDQLSKLKDIITLNTQVTTDFVTSTVAQFNEFEENLKRVGTVFETGLNLEERKANLQEFGLTIQNLVNNNLRNTVTETEALAATYEALSAGFVTASASTQVMEAGLKLAASSGADSGEVMRLLSKTLNAYGKDATEAGKVAGQLNTIVENGITTIGELSAGFGQLSTVASAVGVPLEQTGAALAVLTTKGTSTAQAMTQLQSLFTAFIDPEMNKRLEKLKIDFKISKAVVETKGLVTVLKELDEAVGGNAVKWGQLLPEIQSYRAALALTSDGVTKLEAVTQKMVDTTAKSLEDVFSIRLDNSQITQFTQIVNKLNSTLINVGRSLAPLLTDSINFVEVITKNLSKWTEANLGLIKTTASLALGLKALQGVMGAFIGTGAKLLGIFMTWRFLTGKLLPDLGALFAVSTKGLRQLALAKKEGAGVFTQLGIALKNNALATNTNLTAMGKFRAVLGNLLGLGNRTGNEIRLMGEATGEAAKKFQGMSATEKVFTGLRNNFLKLREGNVKLGESFKNLWSSISGFIGGGLKALQTGLNATADGFRSLFFSPVIPTGIGALAALGAAAYGVSKGFKIIEEQKETLKTALLDIKESIKDTTQTLNSLSFASVKLENLSTEDIKEQLSEVSNLYTDQANNFLKTNEENLARFDELKKQREDLLKKPITEDTEGYEEYTSKLEKINNEISSLNTKLTNELGNDLKLRVLLTQNSLEQLLDNEQEYLAQLEKIEKNYRDVFTNIARGVSDILNKGGGFLADYGYQLEDSISGWQKLIDDWFGGNLGEKIAIDKTDAIIDKLRKDLTTLGQPQIDALKGVYKYENLIIDGKKVEVDLQKELNRLWEEQGNIQDKNYSKFVKTIEAIREELNFQTKAIQKNIELASTVIKENEDKLKAKYSLENNLTARENKEYSDIKNDANKVKYLQETAFINQKLGNTKDFADGNSLKSFRDKVRKDIDLLNDEGYLQLEDQEARKQYIGSYSGLRDNPFKSISQNKEYLDFVTSNQTVDLLRTNDSKELENKLINLTKSKEGKELENLTEIAKQNLEELKKTHESLKKANRDLDLIAKAGSVLNNRLDLNKPNSLADSKTKNFESRQNVIDNTLSAVEKVSKGAIIDKRYREDILKEYETELGADKYQALSEQEKDAYVSKKKTDDLTGGLKDYQQKLDQAYIDFLQDPDNQKKLSGLTDEQKYQEFYKGDTKKYKYKTKPSDIKLQAKTDLKAKGADLTDDEVEALLDSDTLSDKIIEQADSVMQDLEGKFITAGEALRRFDENIMVALGDVGSESIPSILNARLDLIRASNEELLEIEESTAKNLETIMSGVFGESAKQVEEISGIRLKATKSRLETEKQIFQEMVKNGQYTTAQLDERKREIKQLENELLVDEINYLKTRNNITVEEFEKRKQLLEVQQSSEFSANKNRITQLEEIDKQQLENKIKLEKNILENLKASGKLTEEQIKEYQDKIILLEEQYAIKVLDIKGATFQKEYEEREKLINKSRAKLDFFSNQNLITEQSAQAQVLDLQRQGLIEYGKLLEKRLTLTKKNGGDTSDLLIEIQKNNFDLEQNVTDNLKAQFERRALVREKYYERLEYEQNKIKENLNSGIQIATPAIEFLEERKGASGSTLEQLEIEKQIINLREKSSKLDYQLKERNLLIEGNLLKLEREKRIEKERFALTQSEAVVKQKETLVTEAKTNEELELANEQLELALQNRQKIEHQTNSNIERIKSEYREEKYKLDLQKESLKVEQEINKVSLETQLLQNKYNRYQEQLSLLQRFLNLDKKRKDSEKERYANEKRHFEYKQQIEKQLFELDNRKLGLQYKLLQVQGDLNKAKLRQENIERRKETRDLTTRNRELNRELEKLEARKEDGRFIDPKDKERYDDLKSEYFTNLDLINSNFEIIGANNALIKTQEENNDLLKLLIKELQNNKSNFDLQQKADRAEFLSNQNVNKEDKKIGEGLTQQGIRQLEQTTKYGLPEGARTHFQANNGRTIVIDRNNQTIGEIRNGKYVQNFKDGGQVSKSDWIDEIRNTKDPQKVLELGNQVVKALEKEGKDGVPIVANKDEYVLTKEETQIFKQLKQSGIWDSFSNSEIGNYSKGGIIKNKRGQDIPQAVYSQLLKAPEGTTTRLTIGGKPNYYLRTKDGINKVGLGDKYTPTNSAFPFTVVLNNKGLPVLFANDFVYEAGKKNKYIQAKQSYHETDPDFKYRTNVNWTNVRIPVYGYISRKTGERFYKIIKDGKLVPITLRHGDQLSGQKFFINKSEKLNGYLGFHSPQQWAKLDKIDREAVSKIDPRSNSKNPIADPNSIFVRSATQEDIKHWNESRTPALEGYKGYAASSTFALYRQNSTGKYFGLWGDREEDMFHPSYVREGNKVVRKENPNLKRLTPMTIAIKSGTKMTGTNKVFFEPRAKELENKRGFYDNVTKKPRKGRDEKGNEVTLPPKTDYEVRIEEDNYYINRNNFQTRTREIEARKANKQIKNFKDGGKVSSSYDLDSLVSNAKVNETEVFNLGKEILKAIHKEGIGAVPLVANKDEYILNKEDTKIITQLKDTGVWEQIRDNINNYRLGGEIRLENNNEFVAPKFYRTKEGAINAMPTATKTQTTKKLEIEHKINLESHKTGERDMDMIMDAVEKRVKLENDKLMKGLEFEFKNRI